MPLYMCFVCVFHVWDFRDVAMDARRQPWVPILTSDLSWNWPLFATVLVRLASFWRIFCLYLSLSPQHWVHRHLVLPPSFPWVLGIWTWIIRLKQQVPCPLSHLPSLPVCVSIINSIELQSLMTNITSQIPQRTHRTQTRLSNISTKETGKVWGLVCRLLVFSIINGMSQSTKPSTVISHYLSKQTQFPILVSLDC